VIAVQTFGDFQNFNPHLHIIATDGCFYRKGMFIKGPMPAAKDLEDAFRRKVFALLTKEGKLNDFVAMRPRSFTNPRATHRPKHLRRLTG